MSETIFGNQTINPVHDGSAPLNTFELPNGDNSAPAKFIDNPQQWIPLDISNTNSKTKRDPTYAEVLITFGEMHFGAKWDAEEYVFKETPESSKWKAPTRKDKIAYLARFPAMGGKLDKSMQRVRFEYDDDGNVDGITAYKKDKMERFLKVVEAYKDIIFPESSQLTMQEKIRQRAKKEEFKSKATEMEDATRNSFYKLPTIYGWVSNMQDAKKEGWKNTRGALYRIFYVTGLIDNPDALTTEIESLPKNEKLEKVKNIVAIWKHWNSEFFTNKEFYDKEWKDDLMPKDWIGRFPPDTWNMLEDFPEREHKNGKFRNFVGAKKEESSRKSASDYISSFVNYAPKGNWSFGDVPKGTMLSRIIPIAKYGDVGQLIDDDQVQQAFKFLETGKRHIWKDTGKTTELIKPQPDGSIKKEPIKIRELIPDPEDNETHYNTTLKEYQLWGKPYGKTSPASLFFRIALLCGWRKQEGLTSSTRQTSTQKLKGTAGGLDKDGDQPTGLIWEDNGNLSIAFLTRKTKKVGKNYFEAICPPFSSPTMDTRETIALICEKAGLGRWVNQNFKDPNWKPEWREFNQKELDELFPADIVKMNKEVIKKSKGVPATTLIGWQGQFYPAKTEYKGKMIETIKLPDGTDLDALEYKGMVSAFLDFPLRELYRSLKGTKVKLNSEDTIMEIMEGDRRLNPKIKLFKMNDGWAEICSEGCPEKDLGKIQTGVHSRARMDQDVLRYTSPDEYWIKKPNHSLRHIFAQIWLAKSDWNFGIVADRGHWGGLNVLKDHYGDIPKTQLAGMMTQVFSKQQFGEDKMNQGINQETAMQVQQQNMEEVAEKLIEENEPDAPIEVEDEDE